MAASVSASLPLPPAQSADTSGVINAAPDARRANTSMMGFFYQNMVTARVWAALHGTPDGDPRPAFLDHFLPEDLKDSLWSRRRDAEIVQEGWEDFDIVFPPGPGPDEPAFHIACQIKYKETVESTEDITKQMVDFLQMMFDDLENGRSSYCVYLVSGSFMQSAKEFWEGSPSVEDVKGRIWKYMKKKAVGTKKGGAMAKAEKKAKTKFNAWKRQRIRLSRELGESGYGSILKQIRLVEHGGDGGDDGDTFEDLRSRFLEDPAINQDMGAFLSTVDAMIRAVNEPTLCGNQTLWNKLGEWEVTVGFSNLLDAMTALNNGVGLIAEKTEENAEDIKSLAQVTELLNEYCNGLSERTDVLEWGVKELREVLQATADDFVQSLGVVREQVDENAGEIEALKADAVAQNEKAAREAEVARIKQHWAWFLTDVTRAGLDMYIENPDGILQGWTDAWAGVPGLPKNPSARDLVRELNRMEDQSDEDALVIPAWEGFRHGSQHDPPLPPELTPYPPEKLLSDEELMERVQKRFVIPDYRDYVPDETDSDSDK